MIPTFISRTLHLAAAAVVLTGASQAAVMSATHKIEGSPLALLQEPWGSSSGNLSYKNTWKITNKGYDPALHTIDCLTVTFAFADDRPGTKDWKETASGNGGDVEEYVDLFVGGVKIKNNLEVDGRHPSSNYDYHSFVLNKADYPTIYADLEATGMLGFEVVLQRKNSATWDKDKNREDTYLKVAKLEACWSDRPNEKVPEGGAGLAVFGLALAGLMRWKRKAA